jgi:hypothetical protein
MRVLAGDRDAVILREGEAAAVARGARTGDRPAIVQLRIAIATSGDEVAGEYEADVEIRASTDVRGPG